MQSMPPRPDTVTSTVTGLSALIPVGTTISATVVPARTGARRGAAVPELPPCVPAGAAGRWVDAVGWVVELDFGALVELLDELLGELLEETDPAPSRSSSLLDACAGLGWSRSSVSFVSPSFEVPSLASSVERPGREPRIVV
jgi:hypothetical protein